MNTINEKVIRSLLDVEGYVPITALAEMTGYSVSSIKHNLPWIKKELKEYGVGQEKYWARHRYMMKSGYYTN